LFYISNLTEMENQENESFDQSKSLQVIMEMIEISRNKLRNDGVLFIIWGWVLFYSAMSRYLIYRILFSNMQISMFKRAEIVFGLAALAYTLYYLVRQGKKVQTYIGISLRWIWFSLVGSMVLINLIQGNILHKIIFELQHPVFMVVTAFAVVASGVLLRYRLMIIMGICFGLLAYLSSFFDLHTQLLIEAIAWFLAFCLPGHILYALKTKQE
jgi:hypothetical protein